MKTSRKLSAAVVAAVLALSGCAVGSTDDEPEAVPTEAPKGEIRFESWTPTQETFDALAAGYAKEYPGASIQGTLAPFADYQTSLQAQLRSGGGPDVFVVEPGSMLRQFARYIEPVDSFQEATEGEDWKQTFTATSLDRATLEDKVYGLPVGYGFAGLLWVNKTILKREGLQVPTTYEELVQVSKKLKAAGVTPVALGAKDTWQDVDYLVAMAAALDKDALYDAFEGRGEWTAPGLLKAFEAWQALFSDGVVQEGAAGAATYPDTYNLFTEGKAAFFANGSWNLDMYRNSLDLIKSYEVDVIPMPVPGSPTPAPVIGDTTIVVVNKNSENKAAALHFAQYMSQGPGAAIWTNAALDFPVTVDGPRPEGLPDEAMPARRSLENMVATNLAGYRQVPSAAVKTELGNVLLGLANSDLTPEVAAERVQAAADDAS